MRQGLTDVTDRIEALNVDCLRSVRKLQLPRGSISRVSACPTEPTARGSGHQRQENRTAVSWRFHPPFTAHRRPLFSPLQLVRTPMLNELVVEEDGQRYIGRVYAGVERPLLAGQPLRWCFSHRGHFVAEFPSVSTETPEEVKSRLLKVLARIPRQH